MAKSKPYKISSKPTVKKEPKKRTPRKIKESIENTTRIRIDKERLNDVDSLDTSFLEGRVDAKSKKKVLNSKPVKRKSVDLSILRNVILTVLFIVLLVVAVLALLNRSTDSSKPKVKKVTEEKVVKIVDDNYIFVGDFHTDNLNFEDLDYHYTKLNNHDYKTEDLLNNLEDLVYRYNPSIVFIELGFNDLKDGVEAVDTVTNLSEIIDNIKKNRTYTKIYIESIYPINTDIENFDEDLINENVTNERINNLNEMIEELAKDKKVEYIDVYKELSLNDKLNEEYTDNGVYLNTNGYEKVLKLLKKVVDNNEIDEDQ